MLIDTHAHLDFPDFSDDLDAVLARAKEAGVGRIVSIGTSIEGSARAIALAEKYPQVFAVVGVHPSSVGEAPEDIVTPLRELAKHPRVVAIGETGLDYHRLPSQSSLGIVDDPNIAAITGGGASEVQHAIDDAYKESQAAIFQQQLDLAAELGLNVVIHQRDAWHDTLDILKNYSGKLRAVFHCFGGSHEQAQEVFSLGHLVSFTGIVTFKNAQIVQQCAAKIPNDSFMVETDCPYLAPVPYRGKRCEPAHVRNTAEAIALLRGETFDELAANTTRNAQGFFRF
jgi:TatD DNase family protein